MAVSQTKKLEQRNREREIVNAIIQNRLLIAACYSSRAYV
jgi:hypothetical protein